MTTLDDLKKEIEILDNEIKRLRETREMKLDAFAKQNSIYNPGDIIRKDSNWNRGDWLVESVEGSSQPGDCCLHVRRFNKGGTLSKRIAKFVAPYDLRSCSLVEKGTGEKEHDDSK